MKILAIGDPHGKLPKGLDKIVKINRIDVIICVGDVPPVPEEFRKGEIDYFPEDFLKKADRLYRDIIKKLCSYKKPVLVLRGNMYLAGSRNKLTKEIFSSCGNLFHKRTGKIKVNGKNFVLFDMSFEPKMYKNASSWMKRQFKSNNSRRKKLIKLLRESNDAIVVSHAPPLGYLDKTPWGNGGSRILLDAIKKFQPRLVICGHIHEAKGKKKIGKTEVYNVGCCGDYRIIKA
jgi:Icc-related predicted phosphoesterase